MINNIPINILDIKDSECYLLEIQGKIITEDNSIDTKIFYDKDKKRLIVGNRSLDGEIVKLTKPIALIVNNEEGNGLMIKNIYRKKVVFNKYPKLLNNIK